MSEQTGQHAAAGAANTHGPAGFGVEDQAVNVAAGPAPCGCAGDLEQLGARVGGIERVARATAYLAMMVAAGLIYVLWFSPGGPGGGDK